MLEKNLEKFNRLLSLMDANNTLSKEDFLKAFENVVKFVKTLEQRNMADFEAIKKLMTAFMDKSKGDNDSNFGSLKSELNSLLSSRMDEIISSHQTKLKELDDRLQTLKDGKDADEEVIVDKVLSKIKLPEQKQIILDDAFEIRNKLETLNGDDRLTMKAIDGLEEAIDELKKKPAVVGGGGGFSVGAMNIHFTDDETPTGDVNGVNTDFTLGRTPSPASSLKVYLNGQRMRLTEDYTYSNRVITFLTAPETGSIILCDYRN